MFSALFCKIKKSQRQQSSILKKLNVDELYVLKTLYISSHDDGNHFGPKSLEWYYVASKSSNEYYDIFTNTQIEKGDDYKKELGEIPEDSCIIAMSFDKPYISSVEPLRNYVNNEIKELDLQSLFWFVNNTNIMKQLGFLDKENED